jgi:hypothetical protein
MEKTMNTIEIVDFVDYQKVMSGVLKEILNNHLNEAIDQFVKLEESNCKMFPRDLLIGAQLACKLNREEEMLHFLKKAFELGVSIDHLKDNTHLKKLETNEKIWQLILELQKSGHEKYQKSVNLPLRNEFAQLFEKDQDLRAYTFGTRFKFLQKSRKKKWVKFGEEFMIRFKSECKTNGFPSVFKIGLNDNIVTPNSPFTIRVSSTFCTVPLIHNYEEIIHLEGILLDEAKKGTIPMQTYATLMDIVTVFRNANKTVKNDKFDALQFAWSSEQEHIKGLMRSDVDKYDLEREKLGLLSLKYDKLLHDHQGNYEKLKADSGTDYFDLFYLDL